MSTASLWGGESHPPCLFTALLKTVAGQPDAIAVADGEDDVSYAGLLRWARGIALLLDEQGVAPGDPVAVTGERSAAIVAAMLGVTLLGAVYVPLDPEYPASRLQYMLQDSGAKVLLHHGTAPALDSAATPLAIPALNTMAYSEDELAAREPVTCDADTAFYSIYTSGSTGWPKGVAIPHSCLDNMVQWQAAHSPRPDLRTAQFAPLNFDVFFQEVLGTLRGGGTVVIVPERLRRDPVGLLDWLAEQRIERLFLPFVALQMLATVVEATPDLGGVRLVEVNTAGEQLVATEQIRAMFRRLPNARLVNHYGQSESAMVSSYVLAEDPGTWPALPPIGVPLPGCELLVDPEDEDTPTVGELLVAGLPVSLGYTRRPELTAERFVTVEPTPRGHTRVFRTGDLVSLRDGVVQFLSRIDDDVKIRGYRVNLTEVDVHLLSQPGVKAAACVAVETSTGTRNLRAAVAAAPDGPPPDGPAVLERLRQILPEASVPLSLSILPDLPRTPSGKTDRDAVAELIAADIRNRQEGMGSAWTRSPRP
ncbi:amino acid adenylation domain-containing protein [Streptomyces sp. YS-3]|uniref:amino acid adenylation domain-containing protein n=1 Tax=Streptomyces sp. YS-3 TaxID=3381352 RepID=UPI003862A848